MQYTPYLSQNFSALSALTCTSNHLSNRRYSRQRLVFFVDEGIRLACIPSINEPHFVAGNLYYPSHISLPNAVYFFIRHRSKNKTPRGVYLANQISAGIGLLEFTVVQPRYILPRLSLVLLNQQPSKCIPLLSSFYQNIGDICNKTLKYKYTNI